MKKTVKIAKISSLNELELLARTDANYEQLAIAAAQNLGGTPATLAEAIKWLWTNADESADGEKGVVKEVNFCRKLVKPAPAPVTPEPAPEQKPAETPAVSDPAPAPAPAPVPAEKPAKKSKKPAKQAKPAAKAERDAWNALASSRMAAINQVVIRSGKKGATTQEVAEESGEAPGLVTAQLGWQMGKGNCRRVEEKAADGKRTTFRWFAVAK